MCDLEYFRNAVVVLQIPRDTPLNTPPSAGSLLPVPLAWPRHGTGTDLEPQRSYSEEPLLMPLLKYCQA